MIVVVLVSTPCYLFGWLLVVFMFLFAFVVVVVSCSVL